MNNSLVVAGIAIHQDAAGRYSLNDLHRAAGGEKRHQPSDWLALDQTKELIPEISNSGDSRNKPVKSSAGRYGGTNACRDLVYSYAMWVSASFHLKVIRSYDAQAMAPTGVELELLPPEVARQVGGIVKTVMIKQMR